MNTQLAEQIDDPYAMNHAALSPVYSEFVGAASGAESCSTAHAHILSNIPDAARSYQYGLQAWPVIIDRERHLALGQVAVRLVTLAKSVPQVAFKNDFRRLLETFHLPVSDEACQAFHAPDGLDIAVSRCDITLTADGPKLLEFNLGSNIGGWQVYLIENTFRSEPTFADFLTRTGHKLECRNPLLNIFRHARRIGEPHVRGEDRVVNIAFCVRPGQKEKSPALERFLNDRLRRLGIGAALFCYTSESKIELTAAGLMIDGTPAHTVFNYNRADEVPPAVHSAFKSGQIAMLNGPAAYSLGNKYTVAILSQMAEDGSLEPDDCAFIRRHIPWTRPLTETLKFRGDEGPALDILLRHQKELVLKPYIGCHGNDVILGLKSSREDWKSACDRALSSGGYVAQEQCNSLQYLALKDGKPVPHDFVWGLFTAGGEFAGSWVRMLPASHQDGVINSYRGAVESIVFEA